MNSTALKQLKIHGPLVAEIIRELIDGKSSQEILSNVDVDDETLKECVALFDTHDAPIMQTTELIEMFQFCSNGEGILSFLQYVASRHNEKHKYALCIFPFTMTYTGRENWAVHLEHWSFEMIDSKLKITVRCDKQYEMMPHVDFGFFVSEFIYPEKCLYSYQQWVNIVAETMDRLMLHLLISKNEKLP